MKKEASEVLASGSVQQVVDYAIEAHREMEGASRQLEAVKPFLRQAAKEQLILFAGGTGSSNVDLEGLHGSAQVSFPKSSVKERKGVNLLAFKQAIPPAVWTSLFTEKIVVGFAPDFAEKLSGLSASERTLIGNLVEEIPSTPRVSFR